MNLVIVLAIALIDAAPTTEIIETTTLLPENASVPEKSSSLDSKKSLSIEESETEINTLVNNVNIIVDDSIKRRM